MPMEPGWPSWQEEKNYSEGRYQIRRGENARRENTDADLATSSTEKPRQRASSDSALAKAAAEKRRQRAKNQEESHRRQSQRRAHQQKMRRRRISVLSVSFLLIVLVSLSLTLCSAKMISNKMHMQKYAFADVAVSEPLLSDAAVLINPQTHEMLIKKQAKTQKAPASLTKLMTVYTAIESGVHLDDTVHLDTEAFQNLGDAAQAGLLIGEKVSIRDLLYACILPSGADASQALALACAPSIEAFTEKMNGQAEAMGMKKTHFVNPVGIDHPDHQTTAYDMALFISEAIQNPTFMEVISESTYELKDHPGGLTLENRLFDYLNRYKDLTYDGYRILGGKTGYTNDAGVCFATVAEDEEGRVLVAVTLGGEGGLDNYYAAAKDAENLYNAGFDIEEEIG